MTQQEALQVLQQRFPEIADDIFIQRMRSIGKIFGHTDSFTIYVAKGNDCEIIGSSGNTLLRWLSPTASSPRPQQITLK